VNPALHFFHRGKQTPVPKHNVRVGHRLKNVEMAETKASKTLLKPREGFKVITALLSFGS
jgi:hypothetical protein